MRDSIVDLVEDCNEEVEEDNEQMDDEDTNEIYPASPFGQASP